MEIVDKFLARRDPSSFSPASCSAPNQVLADDDGGYGMSKRQEVVDHLYADSYGLESKT